jgi:hypothetical protein
MPLVGFVAPRDPMWLSTLRAMDEELVSDSLVYRYDPSASPDGLRGTEGTFSICTFWYVDALARSGRLEEARLTLEKMSTYANHLGLYSEEIGLTGEQLGNFPQAFSHLALINAALNLDFQLDHGPAGLSRCSQLACAKANWGWPRMPRPLARRVKEQKASSTRTREMQHVASDLTCKPTRRLTSRLSSDLRSSAHKPEPRRHWFPSRGTENLIWSARRLINAQIILCGEPIGGIR